MKRFFKIASIVLVFITTFMFVGCGAKATYDLNGKKFGKEKTISSANYLSTTEATSVNINESDEIEDSHFTTTSEINVDFSIYNMNVVVTSDNYYNKTNGSFYSEIVTKTTVGKETQTKYKQIAGKDGERHFYTGTTLKAVSEVMEDGYGSAYEADDFFDIFSDSVGYVEGTVEKSMDFESFVSKVTTQTTDTAIKYNFVFNSKNLLQAIRTYLNETDFDESIGDLLDQTDFSKLKMSYYLIFLKDANGNPTDIIESNVDLSFRVSMKAEGMKLTVKTNVSSNFRIKEINDNVTFPF